MRIPSFALVMACIAGVPVLAAADLLSATEPLFRTIDLNVGDSCNVTLSDGTQAAVKLLELKEPRDELRQAVREPQVAIEVNGQKATLTAASYRLPVTFAGVQIDCPVTKGCIQSEKDFPPHNAMDRWELNPWRLKKDARLRLWPPGLPWIQPGTLVYPVKQRWFASSTQMANEPVYVNSAEDPATKLIYYHWGLDLGGAEGLDDVLSATDGVVIAAQGEALDPPDRKAYRAGYEDVWIRDNRGWYLSYCHMISVEKSIKPGTQVRMGQKIGVLGKERGAGWSHLHFEIQAPQPSGEYGVLEGYAFLWQAYFAQYKAPLQAVARPHHFLKAGQNATVDGSRSWSAKGPQHIRRYQWRFSDGTQADGAIVTRRYDHSGQFSEVLKVTDADGCVDYDFAVVEVLDRESPQLLPPTIHAVYWPTLNLKAGADVTFKVLTFGIKATEGHERWNFGDGSSIVETQSDGKATYAVTSHRYTKPGHYLVSVSRTNDLGQTATARLHVRID
jgi:murein DD-endopeptidase MepM/ murein hydrolase activator NlpD